jgi:hypothetical protein
MGYYLAELRTPHRPEAADPLCPLSEEPTSATVVLWYCGTEGGIFVGELGTAVMSVVNSMSRCQDVRCKMSRY